MSTSRKKPYPTVLLVHGGPNAADGWGYEPQVQHLTGRDYAVLQVNFRGSGESFWHQSALQWGKLMQQDLYTVLEALIGRGVIDPDNIAIMGTSYGGYASLVSATQGKNFKAKGFSGFRCAISFAGPTCLESMIEDHKAEFQGDPSSMSLCTRGILPSLSKEFVEKQEQAQPDFLKNTLEQQKRSLREVSPLYLAHQIECPVLLLQGTDDLRVPEYHSRRFSKALDEAGIPHTYVTFDAEHGVKSPGDERALAYITEAFLNRHLRGGSVQKPDFTDAAYTTARFVRGEEDFSEFAELLEQYRGWGSLRINPEIQNFFSKVPPSIFFHDNADRFALIPYRDPSLLLLELWLKTVLNNPVFKLNMHNAISASAL